MVSDLPAILDAILWRVGAADCEMWNGHRHGFWKIEKFQVCMASKLPRVVPIRAKSGLVHDLGTQVTTRRGKSGRYSFGIRAKFSCHPVSQFCRQHHSFDRKASLVFRGMKEELRIFDRTQGVVARYGDSLQILSCRDAPTRYDC
ncbi:hypothetical protein TIFTF001_036781 [Ficus carica]|uniref:Uncharacterized protein n=1 Tax=Ficus carica TaxID=3494 RepID=A0AA88E529_FICCA|nr:hypothetical protein TIFTF001_036781 [Ficus carica]